MTRLNHLFVTARSRSSGEVADVEEGFTLIELLVVLLIIGILLAIAIPTFLSVTKSAGDTAVQSNLQTALTNAKTAYLKNGSDTYANIQSQWSGLATGMTSTGNDTTASTGPSSISLGADTTNAQLAMAIWSNSTHNCWAILDVTATPGTAIAGVPAASFPAELYAMWPSTDGSNCTANQLDTDPAALAGLPASAQVSLNGFASV
jgi:type IV pilus assembly protein PilA